MNVTIVGAGFAGVKAAKTLAKDPKVQVTVITTKEYFQYYPALYSTATGHSHSESWMPLGDIFAKYNNVRVHIDTIVGIDVKKKILHSALDVEYTYDKLILATGMVTTYFGIKGLDQYSYGIKSANEIRALKERLYIDLAEKGKLDKNYVVVGAGPTGVELAGALGNYVQELAEYYKIKNPRVKVRLIEAASRVLPRSSEKISQKTHERLERLGVEVQVGVGVEEQNAENLIAGGRPISTHTVIWTSGVTNNPLLVSHPEIFEIAKNKKVEVDENLKASKDVYVVGDNANVEFSGLAQTALRTGYLAAKNILHEMNNEELEKYTPVTPISAVPVGKKWSTFEYKNVQLVGVLPAIARVFGSLHGFSEVLGWHRALEPWLAGRRKERDYFAPTPEVSKLHRRVNKIKENKK